MKLRFITATPLNVLQGSGTFVGIDLLARTLRAMGVEVKIVSPRMKFPIFTVQRLVFNQSLRFRRFDPYDATIGFDLDGYTVAGRVGGLHIACIKGVIADEMRFEKGLTRATMGIQAACERQHVRRATRVMTTSEYARGKIEEYYRPRQAPLLVPELIDLEGWRRLMAACRPRQANDKFIVLSVCRFYRRKRLEMLLAAAERLRERLPNLQIRIVGGGPERERLRRIWREKRLQDAVVWRENIGQPELAQEYADCDVFCLPSVQEGFGIAFLEAMAHGKPIVACRAGATPEVVPPQCGLLTPPDDPEELADAIATLAEGETLRRELGGAGKIRVAKFDAPGVAERFLEAVKALQ